MTTAEQITRDEIAERIFHRLVVDRLNGRRLDAVAIKRYSELTDITIRFVLDDIDEAAEAFLDGAIPAHDVRVGDRIGVANDDGTTMTVEAIYDPGIGSRRFTGPTTAGGAAAISVPESAPVMLISRTSDEGEVTA
jgi:transcription elongation GreA/GreB family factor